MNTELMRKRNTKKDQTTCTLIARLQWLEHMSYRLLLISEKALAARLRHERLRQVNKTHSNLLTLRPS